MTSSNTKQTQDDNALASIRKEYGDNDCMIPAYISKDLSTKGLCRDLQALYNNAKKAGIHPRSLWKKGKHGFLLEACKETYTCSSSSIRKARARVLAVSSEKEKHKMTQGEDTNEDSPFAVANEDKIEDALAKDIAEDENTAQDANMAQDEDTARDVHAARDETAAGSAEGNDSSQRENGYGPSGNKADGEFDGNCNQEEGLLVMDGSIDNSTDFSTLVQLEQHVNVLRKRSIPPIAVGSSDPPSLPTTPIKKRPLAIEEAAQSDAKRQNTKRSDNGERSVISKHKGGLSDEIRKHALKSLRPEKCLNDTAISMLVNCVADPSVLVLDPQFGNLESALHNHRRNKLPSTPKYIIVPDETSHHWTCAIIVVQEGHIKILNSMKSFTTGEHALSERAKRVAGQVLEVAQMQIPEWRVTSMSCPQQTNNTDCGIFMIALCWFSIHNRPLPKNLDGAYWRAVFSMILSDGTWPTSDESDLGQFDIISSASTRSLIEQMQLYMMVSQSALNAVNDSTLRHNLETELEGVNTLLRVVDAQSARYEPTLAIAHSIEAEINQLERRKKAIQPFLNGFAQGIQFSRQSILKLSQRMIQHCDRSLQKHFERRQEILEQEQICWNDKAYFQSLQQT